MAGVCSIGVLGVAGVDGIRSCDEVVTGTVGFGIWDGSTVAEALGKGDAGSTSPGVDLATGKAWQALTINARMNSRLRKALRIA